MVLSMIYILEKWKAKGGAEVEAKRGGSRLN